MKDFSQVGLLVIGLGVIVIGVVLMFMHQHYEADFQNHLLSEFHADYHWRSVGDAYTGLGATVVGALMMAFSVVIIARRP